MMMVARVPCAGEVERRRAVDEDEAEGLDVEPDRVFDGLAQAGGRCG